MRIGFVTQWFPPEPGTVVAAAIADGLADRGHHVDVITGFPNYPTGRLHPDYPLQRYRLDRRSERVRVHRAPLYPDHSANPARRAANYLSFAISAAWLLRRRIERPDVWLTYSSPATAALPVLLSPRRLGAPTFLLIQDLWPDSVVEGAALQGMAGRGVGKVLGALCDWSYRRSAGIGVISPGMQSILVERGVPADSVHLTPNWVEDSFGATCPPAEETRQRLGLPDGRLFMYAGNLGELQGLAPLIEAFGQTPEVSLVLVGDGVAKQSLQDLTDRWGCTNITFLGSQPLERIGEFIAASDVQIVSLKDSPLLRATMPSKVQVALSAGRPILAHAAGDVADEVTTSGAGYATPPGDVDAAVRAIRVLDRLPAESLRAMGRRARSRYEQSYSPEAGLDRLEALLRNGFTLAPR